MNWDTERREPYTEIGIRRMKCARCGAPARFQWQICSDRGNFRPVCLDCDIALNRAVLAFMRHPQAKQLGDDYEQAKRAA